MLPLRVEETSVRFQILTTMSMKMAVFRNDAPSSLADINRRGRAYCINHLGDHPDDGGS